MPTVGHVGQDVRTLAAEELLKFLVREVPEIAWAAKHVSTPPAAPTEADLQDLDTTYPWHVGTLRRAAVSHS